MRRDYQSPTISVEHDKGHGSTTMYMKQLMRKLHEMYYMYRDKQGLLLLGHSPLE